MSDFEIKGLDELKRKLANVSNEIVKKSGRTAVRKAANVIRKDAIARAKAFDDPSTPIAIHKLITTRFNSKESRRTGDISFKVGVRGGAGSKNDAYYWRFLEFGTEKMAARPFMRPAMENSTEKVTETLVTEFDKAIDKALQGK